MTQPPSCQQLLDQVTLFGQQPARSIQSLHQRVMSLLTDSNNADRIGKEHPATSMMIPFAMKLINQNMKLLQTNNRTSQEVTSVTTSIKLAKQCWLEEAYEALVMLRAAHRTTGWELERAHFNVIQRTMDMGEVSPNIYIYIYIYIYNQ